MVNCYHNYMVNLKNGLVARKHARMIGRKVGRLTIERIWSGNGFYMVEFRCFCGGLGTGRLNALAKRKSCGCLKRRQSPLREKAKRLREKFFSLREIARKLHLSHERVRQYLGDGARFGYDWRQKKLLQEKGHELFRQGKHLREIKKILKLTISIGTVSKHLRAIGGWERGLIRQRWLRRRNGRLVVKEFIDSDHIVCLCDCGQETTVRSSNFTRTNSCGCLSLEYWESLRGGHRRGGWK